MFDGVEVDILEFAVPVENNKTLFVLDIEPHHTERHIYDALHNVYSSFGPLYLVKVCPNAPLSPPGFYALVKFYSSSQAQRAWQQTNGHSLFQNLPLKVRLSTKPTPNFPSNSRSLSHARCLELANHYLGFDGWTSEIIMLKELSNDEEEDKKEEEETQTLRMGCLLQLSFPHHGMVTRGAAVVEESFIRTGPEIVLQQHSQLMKRARERALVQAFSSVLLIVLGDKGGKVNIALRSTNDQLSDDGASEHIQVNHPSLSEIEDLGEEWDLTIS